MVIASLALGLVLCAHPLEGQCGTERWSVKTGTDADAGLVNLQPVTATTIATMRSWPAPHPIPKTHRVAPTETTVWVVTATLNAYKLETDSDYHIVLTDADGQTIIAEIPAPACVGVGSPFASAIAGARAEFDQQLHATTSFKTANIPVRVTGVGMFDFLHGQHGVAPNGIELHPVLDIVFNPPAGPTPTSTPTSNPSPTATPAPPPAAPGGDLLANGGFEAGTESWIASPGVIGPAKGEPAHSGFWRAWLGGYGAVVTDTLSQPVAIPTSVTTATLTFWLHIDTAETTTTKAYDTLQVQVRDATGAVLATLATYSNLDATPGFAQKSLDVSAFKGQTVTLYLVATEDAQKQTSFVVDDFALVAD
jgi:hypothetical protein